MDNQDDQNPLVVFGVVIVFYLIFGVLLHFAAEHDRKYHPDTRTQEQKDKDLKDFIIQEFTTIPL